MAHRFPEMLKKIRKDRELTQEELAEKIDIHKNNIVRYELGEAQPMFIHLMRIIDALACSPNDPLGWEPGSKMKDQKDEDVVKRFETAS
jgi:transcriptional regulator with XRE-family HTH domain